MIFYHGVEGWGWLDSLYFSVITLTTVGYGDFAPKTDAGKVFTIIYILVGLGILAGFISLMAQNQRSRAAASESAQKSERRRRTPRRRMNTESQDAQHRQRASLEHLMTAAFRRLGRHAGG